MRRLVSLAFLAVTIAAVGASSLPHERLKIRNDFKRPEEVVSYYCARDASGFVWSGLLDAERTAFTTWSVAPEHDTFFIAKDYKVTPGVVAASSPDHATVKVEYEVTSIADAHGTRVPVKNPKRTVNFELQKVGSAWKITSPSPADLAPVVLESKFPYPVAQN